MARLAFSLSCLAALALACSDDSSANDAGEDATTSDAAKDSSVDAAADSSAVDATPDALTDGGDGATGDATDDAAADDGSVCDAGCKLFSYECKNGNFPACTCLALTSDTADPTCDGGTVSCFQDPCLNKTAACVAGQCAVQ